jgi:hypothetical protein
MPDDLSHLPDVELRYMLRDGRVILRTVALTIRQQPGAAEDLEMMAVPMSMSPP